MTKYLTISIDDGAHEDMRVAELLNNFDLTGTFYIPKNNPERPVMNRELIRELSHGFEIGAHTLSHLPLNRMPLNQARTEIFDSKRWLEDLIDKPVESFCYPQGKFNRTLAAIVAAAGFKGARTCMQNLVHIETNSMTWGATTQAYSHSCRIQVQHALKEMNFLGLKNFTTLFRATRDWVNHFQIGAHWVNKNGGVAHLYLHSWEIDYNKDWHRLKELFTILKTETDLISITNGELFSKTTFQKADK